MEMTQKATHYAVRNIRLCEKDCLCLYVCPTGATNTVKPSFLNTPVKPVTQGVDMTATKATPVRPQPAAANNPNGIKIPDFLKRG